MEASEGLRGALITVPELMEDVAVVFGDDEGGLEAAENAGDGPVIRAGSEDLGHAVGSRGGGGAAVRMGRLGGGEIPLGDDSGGPAPPELGAQLGSRLGEVRGIERPAGRV